MTNPGGSLKISIAIVVTSASMLLVACASDDGDVPPASGTSGGTTGGGPTGSGTGADTGTGTGTGTGTSGGVPAPLVIATTWQEQDVEQTRALTSETDDCFATGFNLKAVLALLPHEHDDTLRTDEAKSGTWKLVRDEPVHVTVDPAADKTKATCSAPVKGYCPTSGDGPCRIASQPTITFEASVAWSTSGGAATTFVGALVATPSRFSIQSEQRMPIPTGWTSWVQYTVLLDGDGFGGTMDDTGCSPCTNHVQQSAAFPPARSVSTRLATKS